MSKYAWALIAATLVSIIYGVTFTIAKDVMPQHVMPYGFIVLRVGGSAVLFWLVWLFLPKQKIEKIDFLRIIASAFFGVALNMLTFFKGLSLTSPISAAVLMVTTPIIVLLLSAILIREKLQPRKILGILLGLAGTVLLIYYGQSTKSAPDAVLGNLLVFINAVSYGLYLIIVKKLMDRYDAFSFVNWIYLIGFLMVLPFGWTETTAVNWSGLDASVWWKLLFVVVVSTFLTYLLNLLSMKTLRPVTVAVFIYLQPLFAAIFSIALGKDNLTAVKIASALMIFGGVYLVIRPGRERA